MMQILTILLMNTLATLILLATLFSYSILLLFVQWLQSPEALLMGQECQAETIYSFVP